MNLQEIMNQIITLGAQISAANQKLAADAVNPLVTMDAIQGQQQAIADLNSRLNALQESYNALKGSAAQALQPVAAAPQEKKSLKEMRASNEYARAFAYAIRNGINRRNGRGNENVKVLYDALTESGGTTPGEDGGFLVPEDIDHTINEVRRSLDPLAALFNEETVTAPTGWRVMDTAPTTGLVSVDEMGEIDDDDDQPAFAKVAYSCAKKALILPVSNELMTDNVANLFAYLGRWFAKKLVITENGLLIAALKTLTATSIASAPLAGIKGALNKGLDPAISVAASIILNQDAYDILDNLEDDNKRPLLQPDPTNATAYRLKGRPVHMVSNAVLGNVTTGSGQNAVTTSDIYIGDGKQFATLFRCGGYELASTNIGGEAWRTDSTELRGITRLGVSKFDTAATVRRSLSIT